MGQDGVRETDASSARISSSNEPRWIASTSGSVWSPPTTRVAALEQPPLRVDHEIRGQIGTVSVVERVEEPHAVIADGARLDVVDDERRPVGQPALLLDDDRRGARQGVAA